MEEFLGSDQNSKSWMLQKNQPSDLPAFLLISDSLRGFDRAS
jgi:hypothetical protein